MPTTLKERARQRYSKAEQVFRVPSWADASLVDQCDTHGVDGPVGIWSSVVWRGRAVVVSNP